LFFPNSKAPDYSVVEGEDSFYTRLDQAESIDSVLRPLLISEEINKFPVIDIGCGLGFASDFVRFSKRASLAIDPSSSSKLSSKLLGIPIQENLSESEIVGMNAQRIIYCSEVIEHVDNPRDFMHSLKSYSGALGYLILTTPNSDFVSKNSPIDGVISILAPSQHLFIFSKKSLEKLARDSGFMWVHAWTINERLFLIAGPRKVDLNNEGIKGAYIEYLEDRLKNTSVPPILRQRSYGYRLFKELVNDGQYERASTIWSQLIHFYRELNLDLNDPDSVYLKGPARNLLDTLG
jgi:SAM-dependent methyltransferase